MEQAEQRTHLSTLRAASIVARLHLRRRLRDRSAILQGVVAPVLLAVIIAAAFGGGASFTATIAVVDQDGGAIGGALGDADAEALDLIELPDRTSAIAAIDAGDADAAIVIPEGFDTSLATEPLPIEVLVDEGRAPSALVAEAIAAQTAARIDATRLAVLTATTADPDLIADPGVEALAPEAAERPPPVLLGPSAFGEGFEPIAYFAPSMAMLFAFLTLGTGARALLVERREGTLARVRSTPVSDRSVLAGVTASVVAVGLASFAMVWLVTAAAFGADWGEPFAVAVVIAATVLAISGISTLVTGLARTEAQADGTSSVLAFGFALLGGGFLSPGDLPDVLARISLLTPNRWALDAFAQLSAGAAGLSAVVTQVAVLTAIGLVTGALGLRLVRLDAR